MNIRRILYDNHWTLGFPQNSLESIIRGDKLEIKWMDNPYKDRWFADPFILSYDDKCIYLLVEEFYDPIRRGRISRISVDRNNYRLKTIDVVLELPTHLSFPAIKRVNGDILFYPENGASGKLTIYKYNPDTNICDPVSNLADGCLADAIETNLFSEPLLFTTIVPKQNSNELIVLKQIGEKYEPFQTVFFNANIARNAGDWFLHEGCVYRPAQDCTNAYGGEMILQKVEYANGTFVFQDIRRISERYKSYNLGCHTFNHLDGISVIDVNGYRRPMLALIGKKLVDIRHRK